MLLRRHRETREGNQTTSADVTPGETPAEVEQKRDEGTTGAEVIAIEQQEAEKTAPEKLDQPDPSDLEKTEDKAEPETYTGKDWPKANLSAELKSRGLDESGTNAEQAARLVADDEAKAAA